MSTLRDNIVSNFFWLFFLAVGLILASCSNNQKESKKEIADDDVQTLIIKPGSSYNDTLFINTESVVLFDVDSMQSEKLRKVVSPMVWESLHHDCYYQQRNARTILKQQWPKLKVSEAMKQRYILFKKNDGKTVCIDTDKLDVCGMLLFNTKKDPQTADLTNIETELRYYFEFPN